MVTVTDNLDLGTRRKRLGLSQQDIADLLCGYDPFAGSTDPSTGRGPEAGKGFSYSNVSRFETGDADSMPPRRRGERRLTRDDYIDLLDSLEQPSQGGQ